jgi:hypothetical protein
MYPAEISLPARGGWLGAKAKSFPLSSGTRMERYQGKGVAYRR